MTSLMIVIPAPLKPRLRAVVVLSVMVDGEAADPRMKAAGAVVLFVMLRLAVPRVIGPLNVRLCGPVGSWAALALSAMNPVVSVMVLATVWSALTAWKCALVVLLIVIVPVPNGPAVNGELELVPI